jgi:hypothetical protein
MGLITVMCILGTVGSTKPPQLDPEASTQRNGILAVSASVWLGMGIEGRLLKSSSSTFPTSFNGFNWSYQSLQAVFYLPMKLGAMRHHRGNISLKRNLGVNYLTFPRYLNSVNLLVKS